MKNFFISKDIFIFLIIISILVIFFASFSWLVLWFLVLSSYFYIFRKNKVIYKDTLSNSTEIILSPINGKVIAINEGSLGKRIKIAMEYKRNFGLYLPYSGEITKVDIVNGKKSWRSSKQDGFEDTFAKTRIEFKNKMGNKIILDLIGSHFGAQAKIWLKIGDKGRASANFGYVPFGTSLILTLPEQSNTLVTVGDKVIASSTIIAGLKG